MTAIPFGVHAARQNPIQLLCLLIITCKHYTSKDEINDIRDIIPNQRWRYLRMR